MYKCTSFLLKYFSTCNSIFIFRKVGFVATTNKAAPADASATSVEPEDSEGLSAQRIQKHLDPNPDREEPGISSSERATTCTSLLSDIFEYFNAILFNVLTG